MSDPDTSRRERKKRVVAHLTSVHPASDVRIFHKECRSLSRAGYDVRLIVPVDRPEIKDGVRTVPVPIPRGRGQRMLRTAFHVLRAAVREKAALCHFHDPELMPIGLILKLLGKKVIYDVHDNLVSDILEHKPYLPRCVRWPLSLAADVFERVASRGYDRIVVATPAIGRRFPARKTVLVQNFPDLPATSLDSPPPPYGTRSNWIVFAGMISEARAVREMVQAMTLLPAHLEARLKLLGSFDPEGLDAECRSLPGWEFVDYLGWRGRDHVLDVLNRSRVGMVLYHPGLSHNEAQPNKLYEYLAVGIPVIASNFPHWKRIIDPAGCGLTADPKNPGEIASAIERILTRPEEAEAMGARGKAIVVSRYQWSAEAEKLVGAYDDLLRVGTSPG